MPPKAVVDVFDTSVAETLTPVNRSHTFFAGPPPGYPSANQRTSPDSPNLSPYVKYAGVRKAWIGWVGWLRVGRVV